MAKASLILVCAGFGLLVGCGGGGNSGGNAGDGTTDNTNNGRVVKNDGNKDDPTVVSRPILGQPIYECTKGVWVSGFIPGAKIDIFQAGNPTPVGGGTSLFASGAKFNLTITCAKGMVLTAKQTWNGVTSGPSNAVTVRAIKDDYPNGLPKPRIDPPPLYKCGRAIGARDLLNGSRLDVFAEKPRMGGGFDPPVNVGSTDNAQPWDYAFTNPFDEGARVRVSYHICNTDSPLSDPEIVKPQPAIPMPTIDQGYEGQQIVVVRNTVNGSDLGVYANAVAPPNKVGGQPTPVSWGQEILVNPAAAVGVPFIPTAALCDPPVQGPPMNPKPCSQLPAPRIKRPAPGDDYVEVLESVPGAEIHIFVSGKEIGDGGGNVIKLIRPLADGEVVEVLQSLGHCTSQWVFEIPVGCNDSNDLQACRADWPSFGHDSTRAAHQPKLSALADPFQARTLHPMKVKWMFVPPTSPAGFRASPVVYKGVVYIGNGNGRFYAVDEATGKMIWQYPKPDQRALVSQYWGVFASGIPRFNPSARGIANTASIARIRKEVDAVIFGAPDQSLPPKLGSSRLFALDLNGNELWKSPAVAVLDGLTPDVYDQRHEQIGYSSPVVLNDRVYVGVGDHADSPIQKGRVVAVDLNGGGIVGAFNFQSTNIIGGDIWSAITGGPNGELYTTTGNSNVGRMEPSVNNALSLLRLDPSSGNISWKLQPVPYSLDQDPDWASGPQSARASCGSVVASTQKDGWSYAVNAAPNAGGTPNVIWQFPPTGFPFTSSPPVHGDSRYLVPGAIWNGVFSTMMGGVTLPDGPDQGYDKLHGLNICNGQKDPLRWLLKVPDTSSGGPYQMGAITVTRGIYFVGTATGHLVVFADPSVVPSAGLVCENSKLSPSACAMSGYPLVPQPWLVADVNLSAGPIWAQPVLADGRVFVATDNGTLLMLEP